MKKLLLLLLLCPLPLLAEFYEGVVTFSNGSVRTGLIEIPSKHNSPYLKFKTSKKAKAEKFSVEEVQGFTIMGEDNTLIKYITLKLASIKFLKAEYKIEEKKSWVMIRHEGNINIVTAYYNNTSAQGWVYYLHKPWEDHCYYLIVYYGGMMFPIGEFKNFKKVVNLIFKEDCPGLSESFTKEEFKEMGPFVVPAKFAENCTAPGK